MKRKVSLLPFVLIAAFIVLLNSYVLSGISSLISIPHLPYYFWSAIAAICIAMVFAIVRRVKHGMDFFTIVVAHIVLILLTSELIMALMLIPDDLYRLIAGTTRNLYWVEAAFLMMLLTIFVFVYGMIFGKYNYKVIHHTLYFDNLPEAFDGFKLVQISDVHAGSFKNSTAVQRGIALIKAQQADLFVFTGDLVNNKAEEIKPWISYFSEIRAPFGQFSVLGNHDYGDYVKWDSELAKASNLAQLKAYHKELGFDLLLDRHVELQKDGQRIILAGVENWGIGFGERGDLEKALSGTSDSDFKILLSHDPTHWESQVKTYKNPVQLTLAGHTHGMQFGLEAFGIKWSPVKYRYAHWAGIKTENNRTLNINRGFGFLGFSGRVGIWPEITLIELKCKK